MTDSHARRTATIAALGRAFAAARDVAAAWLFGSMARGDDRADSDVDVGVLLDPGLRGLAAHERAAEIQDQLVVDLGRSVDVVPLGDAPVDLVHRVLRDGILVHEMDHSRRLEFEVRARNEYWDLLPILELYRRTVLRDA